MHARPSLVGPTKLSNRDCAVAFTVIKGTLTVIASIYCDINLKIPQVGLVELLDFIKNNNYPLILGMDSNAHSTLYGLETNKRGEDLEDIIFQYNLEVVNVLGTCTFEAYRGDTRIATCIDVTLTCNLTQPVKRWRTDSNFNGSDHRTILFEMEQSPPEVKMVRNYKKKADWNLFSKFCKNSFFFFWCSSAP